MAEGYTDPNIMFNAVTMEGLESSLAQQLTNHSSPPGQGSGPYTFSRASSTNSVHISSGTSSTHNSDEEDSCEAEAMVEGTYRERRREAHTEAERKRREAIKRGYDELQDIVPTCHNTESLGSSKLSKATILQKSIEYIQHLAREKKKQEESLEKMRRDVMALKIMKANYEHIVRAHQSSPQSGQNQVSDETKFQVFQSVMDNLFQSFNATISVANFAELSGCVFSWLEEYCQPQLLKDLTRSVLRQVNNQLSQNE